MAKKSGRGVDGELKKVLADLSSLLGRKELTSQQVEVVRLKSVRLHRMGNPRKLLGTNLWERLNEVLHGQKPAAA
jgi:hypothetical protein